jgi:hypothetical protein
MSSGAKISSTLRRHSARHRYILAGSLSSCEVWGCVCWVVWVVLGWGLFGELCFGLLGGRGPWVVGVLGGLVMLDVLGHEGVGLQGLADQFGCVFSGLFCQWPVAPMLEV